MTNYGGYEGSSDVSYTGKERDQTGLYYFNARYYDASIGRFITEDPARNGMNWFVYCNNNPLSFNDLSGLAPRNLSDEQRLKYMQYVSRVTPADIPNSYDCADTALYIYDQAIQVSTGQKSAYSDLTKNGVRLLDIQDIQAGDTFGINNQHNKIVHYYRADGSGQTYDSSIADKSFNSKNIEVGTVGIYAPAPGAKGFTGHTITVVGVTRDIHGDVLAIQYIEGHMSGEEQQVHTFTHSAGDYGISSLYNRYSDTYFIGWGEYEP